MKRLLAGLALTALLGATPSMAFDQAHLDNLNTTKRCPGCDLSGADLAGANLTNANLSGAMLNGATWTDGKICAEGSIGECR